MPVTLLTVTEYARRRGCDEKAVRKAIEAERITAIEREGKRLIDPDVADIQWAKNTRARADSARGNVAAPAPASAGDPPPGQQTAPGDDYNTMRARRERADALKAEHELEQVLGKVMNREPALRAIYTAFRELRDSSLGLGRKLAPVLAPVTDAREIRITIDRAQADIFDNFARRSLQKLVDGLAGHPVPLPADLLQEAGRE